MAAPKLGLLSAGHKPAATTENTIYQPTSTRQATCYARFANQSGSADTVTVHLRQNNAAAATTNEIAHAKSIAGNDVWALGPIQLGPLDILSFQSANGNVSAVVHGAEEDVQP